MHKQSTEDFASKVAAFQGKTIDSAESLGSLVTLKFTDGTEVEIEWWYDPPTESGGLGLYWGKS